MTSDAVSEWIEDHYSQNFEDLSEEEAERVLSEKDYDRVEGFLESNSVDKLWDKIAPEVERKLKDRVREQDTIDEIDKIEKSKSDKLLRRPQIKQFIGGRRAAIERNVIRQEAGRNLTPEAFKRSSISSASSFARQYNFKTPSELEEASRLFRALEEATEDRERLEEEQG